MVINAGPVSAADSVGYMIQTSYPASDNRLIVYITQMDTYKNLVPTPMEAPVWTCYFQRVGDEHGKIIPTFEILPSYSKYYETGSVQIRVASFPKKVGQYLLYVTTLNSTMISSCPFKITIIPGP